MYGWNGRIVGKLTKKIKSKILHWHCISAAFVCNLISVFISPVTICCNLNWSGYDQQFHIYFGFFHLSNKMEFLFSTTWINKIFIFGKSVSIYFPFKLNENCIPVFSWRLAFGVVFKGFTDVGYGWIKLAVMIFYEQYTTF